MRIIYFVVFIVLTLFFGFALSKQIFPTYSKEINTALESAGENRSELEKVLEHYKMNDADPLKFKAAEFVIKNMAGNFSFDTVNLSLYRPILLAYDSLLQIQKEHGNFDYDSFLIKKWEDMKTVHPLYQQIYNLPVIPDLRVINSVDFIQNIDDAFNNWQQNPYNDSITFNDFCEYILPYRRKNGLAIENIRKSFSINYFNDLNRLYPAPVISTFDTILLKLQEFKHSNFLLSDYPYLKISDFMVSKRGLCEDKAILNSYIFSSLGFPVAIDYVPAWGNRDHGHCWNVLIYGGKSYAFEPFWDGDRWKYKRIYNNVNIDENYGKFRLPKVFRHTFSTHIEGPATDKRVSPDNVPIEFTNLKKKDVSAEYFKTTDISVKIVGDIPEDTYYAYLCVYNERGWKPVQWGKIENREVTFMRMGRNIVYLPAFFKGGQIIPAAGPILLQQDGFPKELKLQDKVDSVRLTRKFRENPYSEINCVSLVGGKFEISNTSTFLNPKRIFRIEATPKEHPNIYRLDKSYKSRYVRFVLPKWRDNVAELFFYSYENDTLVGLSGYPICSDKRDLRAFTMAFDGDVLSFIRLGWLREEHKKLSKHWLGLDFGKKVKIDAVGICPRNDKNYVYPGLNYELFYWDGLWKSLGIKMAASYQLVYQNVPLNALLLLKCLDAGKEERIFTYDNHKQVWW